MKLLVSVVFVVFAVLPTYSNKDYLAQTLKSIFAQTSRNFEIILVIDFINKLITISDPQTLSIFSSSD